MRLAHILVCHTVDPTKAIESIPHTDNAFWYVFLHSENADIEHAVNHLMALRDGNVFSYRTNWGLARSWNEGMHLAMEADCIRDLSWLRERIQSLAWQGRTARVLVLRHYARVYRQDRLFRRNLLASLLRRRGFLQSCAHGGDGDPCRSPMPSRTRKIINAR